MVMSNKRFWAISILFFVVGCHETPYVQGKRLYEANCQNCHMEDGSGLNNLVPALSQSPILGHASMACTIRYGKRDTLWQDQTYLLKEMPNHKSLSATEIANIVNYVNKSWFSDFKEFTIIEVEDALKNCEHK